jgi:hypothetical protein
MTSKSQPKPQKPKDILDYLPFDYYSEKCKFNDYYEIFAEGTKKIDTNVPKDMAEIKRVVTRHVDPNVIYLHGGIYLQNFIKVPDNFYIIHFGRDDRYLKVSLLPELNKTNSEQIEKLRFIGFMYLLISIWFLYIYKILRKYESEKYEYIKSQKVLTQPDINNILLEHSAVFEIMKANLREIINTYLYIFSERRKKHTQEIGQDIYQYKPGDIISDISLIGNEENSPHRLLLGITDVFTFHKKSNEFPNPHFKENKPLQFYDFQEEHELYGKIKNEIDPLNRVYPISRGGFSAKLSTIIDVMIQRKEKKGKKKVPTILFVISCRDISTYLFTNESTPEDYKFRTSKVLRIKREKSFLFPNVSEEIQHLTKYAHEQNQEIEWDRIKTDKKKILDNVIANSMKDPKFHYSNREFSAFEIEMTHMLFLHFCIGPKDSLSGIFFYFEDYLNEPFSNQIYNNTLLGLKLALRDDIGQVFNKPDASFYQNDNDSNLPENIHPLTNTLKRIDSVSTYFIPDNNAGQILLMSFKHSPNDIEFILFVLNNIEIDSDSLENLLNLWIEQMRAIIKPTEFDLFKKTNLELFNCFSYQHQSRYKNKFSTNFKMYFSILYDGTKFKSLYSCPNEVLKKLLNQESYELFLEIYQDDEKTFLQKKYSPGTPFLYIYFIEFLIANCNYYTGPKVHFMDGIIINEDSSFADISQLITNFDMFQHLQYNFNGKYTRYKNVYNPKNYEIIKKELDYMLNKGEPFIHFFYRYANIFFISQIKTDKLNTPVLKKTELVKGIGVIIVYYLINQKFMEYTKDAPRRSSYFPTKTVTFQNLLNEKNLKKSSWMPPPPLSPITFENIDPENNLQIEIESRPPNQVPPAQSPLPTPQPQPQPQPPIFQSSNTTIVPKIKSIFVEPPKDENNPKPPKIVKPLYNIEINKLHKAIRESNLGAPIKRVNNSNSKRQDEGMKLYKNLLVSKSQVRKQGKKAEINQYLRALYGLIASKNISDLGEFTVPVVTKASTLANQKIKRAHNFLFPNKNT